MSAKETELELLKFAERKARELQEITASIAAMQPTSKHNLSYLKAAARLNLAAVEARTNAHVMRKYLQ
jgi:hypothetical protein